MRSRPWELAMTRSTQTVTRGKFIKHEEKQ